MLRQLHVLVDIALLSSTLVYGQLSETPDATGASRILLVDAAIDTAPAMIVGAGVDLGTTHTRESRDPVAAHLFWKQRGVVEDAKTQMRHVTYQQYFSDGVNVTPILGAYLSLHFRAGSLTSVLGTQFTSVSVANRIGFSKTDAIMRAHAALAAQPGFARESVMRLTPATVAHRADLTRVVLASDGTGGTLRYHYLVPVADADDEGFRVALDAEVANVVAMSPAGAAACPHAPQTPVAASGYSQTGTLRSYMYADSPGQVPGFTYDGTYAYCGPFGSSGGGCALLQYTEAPTYYCSPDTLYTVFPVVTYNGAPRYDSALGWDAPSGVDALWGTHETWSYLYQVDSSWFYGTNYYGMLGTKYIEIGDPNVANNAWYYAPWDVSARHPSDSVVIGPKDGVNVTYAIAQDIVAHEWGHQIATKIPGWPYYGVGAELQEGFADAFGIAVNQMVHTPDPTDWNIGSALGSGYLRSGINNDENQHCLWMGSSGWCSNNKWHRNEATSDPHDVGNMLSVAFHLLADGGQNAYCAVAPSSRCDNVLPTVTGIGFPAAMHILLNIPFYYGYCSQDWQDIANTAAIAARDRYNYPPYCTFIRDQTIAAFEAIGYRPQTIPACP